MRRDPPFWVTSSGPQTRFVIDSQKLGKKMYLASTRASDRHDEVMTWKRFPQYWPFMRGIHADIFFVVCLNELLNKHDILVFVGIGIRGYYQVASSFVWRCIVSYVFTMFHISMFSQIIHGIFRWIQMYDWQQMACLFVSGLILGLRPANERRSCVSSTYTHTLSKMLSLPLDWTEVCPCFNSYQHRIF